jgi:hypothetical protein
MPPEIIRQAAGSAVKVFLAAYDVECENAGKSETA